MPRYTNRSAMRSHNLSLRQRVRCPVPNLCLNALSSIDQGEVREKNVASFSRASSQVMPEPICCVLGHLTQNHKVVSPRSPRINGSQFSSSVLGIRSGFVSTPVNNSLLIAPRIGIPDKHTDGPVAARVIFLSEPMRTLVYEIGCTPLI